MNWEKRFNMVTGMVVSRGEISQRRYLIHVMELVVEGKKRKIKKRKRWLYGIKNNMRHSWSVKDMKNLSMRKLQTREAVKTK